MPIKPENRALYPANWKAISERIRGQRARWRCECSGQCGDSHDSVDPPTDRCQALHGFPHPMTTSKVVLTTAHLDHDPTNCADGNLMAMCQKCHNRYDAAHRAETRRSK